MIDRAYAKINLSLDVVQRMENGYHELSMIMVPIDFYDVIEINIADEMSLESNAGYLPIDEKNTVIKAIEIMRREFKFEENFKIKIKKHIPTQAGLAGGSSDGASAIKLVNKLLKLNLPMSKMLEIAKNVGADVPFCLLSKPALVGGIGENLIPFIVNTDFWIILVKPKKGISTKVAFESLDFNTIEHPNVIAMQDALINNDYEKVIANLKNTLEIPALNLVPEIANVKKDLLEIGLDGVLMSGSGSTVFGITKDEKQIDKACLIMKSKGYFVRKTKIKNKN